jgi:TM2 domain-containing membrane protein YozV
MNQAIKAALFNALLFPGWGEIYLKKYKRGILIIAAFSAGILSILWSIVQSTISILKMSPSIKGSLTLNAVIRLAIDAIQALNFNVLLIILLSLLILWIVSIFDAYFLGKEEMKRNHNANESI